MATDDFVNETTDAPKVLANPIKPSPSDEFRLHVMIVHEEDGTLSGIVLNLPGAGSCGDTEEELFSNVREAVLGIIECYRASNEQIPWKETSAIDLPTGARTKWILVDA
jgi:predicted RNase H-like HicB family nuclease